MGRACLAMALLATPALRAATDIAQVPLFLTPAVAPNIMFTLDDSGSMQWEHMPSGTEMRFSLYMFPRPDGLYGGNVYANQVPNHDDDNLHNFYGRSAHNNRVFYNPDVTYEPWANADGSRMPDADPTAARYHPVRNVGTLNLTQQQNENATWFRGTSFGQVFCGPCGTTQYWPISYYNYTGGDVTDRASYQRVQITSATPASATFTSPGGVTRTRDEEIQNFANWFQYYRSRVLAAFGGIGNAFTRLPDNARVGYGTINQGSNTVDGVATRTIRNGVRPFDPAGRQTFYDQLYLQVMNQNGTPLRRAAEDVGQYFERSDSRGPWSTTPGANGGEDLACRQSFHVLMTDGFWNGGNPAVGNADGTSGPLISAPDGSTYQYTAAGPFEDTYSNTLADVGMAFWKKDLRTDIPNEVPVSAEDPAFWQHLVTYGVGLGVTGSIDPAVAFAAVASGTDISWPQPTSTADTANIDDLLHFGLNSRGGFFSADDPDAFADELGNVLADIVERVEASATSAATSAAVLQTDTLLYSASFRSDDWSGEVLALAIDPVDGSVGSAVWSAENVLAGTATTTRTLLTHNGTAGVALDYAELSTVQQSALDHDAQGNNDGRGADRISWLRGNEISGLRSRSDTGSLRLLGDIINGTPQYIESGSQGYQLLRSNFSPALYNAFALTKASRPEMLLVPSNGGMLHAFDAQNGSELFAYTPAELLKPEPGESFSPVSRLTAPDYDHRYLLDGTPTVSDVVIGGAWKTVAVGAMGLGGRTVFALDISDPDNMGPQKVLWEFTDPDLGYGVTDVQIVPLENNSFAAVFGNGYNSANHRAVLFVVDISDGSLLAKIDTGVGSSTTPNGLAPALVTDWPDNDLIGHYVYAGDLLGNLWRFDVSSPSPAVWKNSNKRLQLFSAVDSDGDPQPITVQPRIALNPERPGELMLLFGTGSFFRQGDRDASDPQVQTLYGVSDAGGNTSLGDRDALLEQSITYETTAVALGATRIVREVSDNAYSQPDQEPGWFLDLAVAGNAEGERVISRATFPSSSTRRRVRFTTLRVDADPCSGGREGFIFDLDLTDGSQFDQSVFDINSDGLFNTEDLINNKQISAIGGGFGEELTIIRQQDGTGDFFYDGGGNRVGSIGSPEGLATGDPVGRQSWQQLR